MADNVNINLNINTDNGNKSLRQMKMEMKQLQIEMTNTTDPAKFKRLEQEFAILRNDMMDTSKAMRYMDPGEMLGGWIKMTQGIVGSFAAVTGAMSLFGSENEEIQAIERKSMALIQIMMGLEQARMLLVDGGAKAEKKALLSTTVEWFKKTAAQISNTVATTTQTVATKGATLATEGSTVATRTLGIAMKALPIIAVVAGLAAIGAAGYLLVKSFQKSKSTLEELGESQKEVFDEAFKSEAKMKTLGDNIKNTTVGTKENTEAIAEYNIAAKEQNLILIDANDSLSTQNSILSLNNDMIIQRSKLTAAQNEMDKNNAEILRRQIAIREAGLTVDDFAARFLKEQIDQYEKSNAALLEFMKTEKEESKTAETIAELRKKNAETRQKITDIDAKTAADKVAADKVAADNWKARNEAADKRLQEMIFKSKSAQEQLEITYFKDAAEFKKNLDDKLWNQEEYNIAIELLNKRFIDDRNKLNEDIKKLDRISTEEQTEEVKLRNTEIQTADNENYAKSIMSWDETNKTKLELLKYYHDKELISDEDYWNNSLLLISNAVDKYTDAFNQIGSNISTIFSNLTEMMMIEIEKQDYAWQESYNSKNESLNNSLEKAKEVWGEESKQYKYLLDEQKKLEDDKKAHDDDIAKQKKDAQNKYAKLQIGIQMAMATSEFAKGILATWTGSIMELGPIAGPILASIVSATLLGIYSTQMSLMGKQMGAIGKMRKGGLIAGPSHESGGIIRELEGGEAVINARSMSMPGVRNLTSAINELGGGTSFSDGGTSALIVDSDSVAAAVIKAIESIPVNLPWSDVEAMGKKATIIQNKTTF